MRICFRYLAVAAPEKRVPVIQFHNVADTAPFNVSIGGFPVPKDANEAVKYATQATHRFLEWHMGNTALPGGGTFGYEVIERRRLHRKILNKLIHQDLNHIPLECLEDIIVKSHQGIG